MRDIEAVVVPKDLYYHEVAYVRRLEALQLKADELISDLLGHEGAEGWSESTNVLIQEYANLLAEHQVVEYGKDTK